MIIFVFAVIYLEKKGQCCRCCLDPDSSPLWIGLYIGILVLDIIFYCWVIGVGSFCPGIRSMDQLNNINSKINVEEGPSAGADFIAGTEVCTIYTYVGDDGEFDTVESSENDFGIKVGLHEYIHCVQQGQLNGEIDDTTTSYDDIDITILNPCEVDDIFVDKMEAAFESLPSAWRLIPKIVVFLIPRWGCDFQYTMSDLQELVYGAGCPGWSPTLYGLVNEVNAIAEGEAEYYSMNVLSPLAVTDWTTPYDGPAAWNIKMSENFDSCGVPGNEFLTVRDGSSDWLAELGEDILPREGYEDCRGNPIGELTFDYLINYYRTETTATELKEIWRTAFTEGFADAFEQVLGSSWSDFIQDMEQSTEYDINPDSEGYPGQPYRNPNSGSEWGIVTTVMTVVFVILLFVSSFLLLKTLHTKFSNNGTVKPKTTV